MSRYFELIVNFLRRTESIVIQGTASLGFGVWWVWEPSNMEPLVSCLIFFIATVVSLIARGTKGDDKVFVHLKRELSAIEGLITDLKMLTALNQLEGFKKELDTNELSASQKYEIQSYYYFLKGMCMVEMGENTNEGFEDFIKAQALNPSVLRYRERALSSAYILNQFELARRLMDEISAIDGFNERVWAVRLRMNSVHSIEEVPSVVREKLDFKHIHGNYLLGASRFEEFEQLVRRDWNGDLELVQIDSHNHKYYSMLSFYFYNAFLKNSMFYLDTSVNDNNSDSVELKKSRTILRRLFEQYGKSELYLTTYYYQQVGILLNFVEYSFSGEKNGIFQNYRSFKDGFSFRPDAGIQMTIALAQLGEYEKAIEVCEYFDPRKFLDLCLIKADCLAKLGKSAESKVTYLEFIDLVPSIDETAMKICMVLIDMTRADNQGVEELQSRLINKTFKRDEIRILVEGYAFRTQDEKVAPLLESIQIIADGATDRDVIVIICIILASQSRFDVCHKLIEPFTNKEIESKELHMFIEFLYRSGEKEKVLDYLVYWNDHFDTDEQFIKWEMELIYFLGNYKRIVRLGEIGMRKFPSSREIFFYFFVGLYRTNGWEKVRELIPSISSYKFSYREAFQFALMCFEIGEREVALEISYRTVVDQFKSIPVKEAYFGIIQTYGTLENPERSSVDTSIRLKKLDEISLVHLTQESLKEVPENKAFLNKVVGNKVTVFRSLTAEMLEYEVIGVMNKYDGMMAEIMTEVHQQTPGYKIVSVNIPEGGIEAIHNVFKKKFGVVGEERNNHINESLRKYESGELSFLQLTSAICPKEPLVVYQQLTRFGKWMRIPANRWPSKPDFSNVEAFIVDITVLPIFVELDKGELFSDSRFVVSAFLVEHIKEVIEDLKKYQGKELSVVITTREVIPSLTSKDVIDQRRKLYERYLKWIEENCTIEYAPSKLQIMDKMDKSDWTSWHVNYSMDVLFLSNVPGKCLITDDESLFRLLSRGNGVITSEVYLQNKLDSELLRFYMNNRYVGCRLNCDILKEAFDSSSIYEKNQYFKNCLNALDFRFHRNRNVLYEVVKFLKYLYSLTQNTTFKNSVAEIMLIESLRNYPRDIDVERFIGAIRMEFHFLGNAEKEILSVLVDVLNIFRIKHTI